MSKDFDEGKAKRELEEGAKRMSEKDVERVLERKKEFEEKLKGVPGRLTKMVNQLGLLFELIGAYWKGDYREIPWMSIATAVFAVIYFMWPFDLIPDFIPVLGLLDDAAVVALAIVSIQDDLRKFCEFKG